MTLESPPFEERGADDIVAEIRDGLSVSLATYGWQGEEGGAGLALAHLFGRMAELIMVRLNQVPEKHFLAHGCRDPRQCPGRVEVRPH